MSFTVLIPARLESQRLPGKVLLPLAGKPIIQWVYEKAIQSGADRVVIATDSEAVEKTMRALGAEVVITNPNHTTGSDRIAEAARLMNLADDAVLVNLQADEPFMPVANIRQLADIVMNHPVPMATLCHPMTNWEKVQDPNTVKVVFNQANEALYFSRSPIPHIRVDFDKGTLLPPISMNYNQHIGIYAYRGYFLQQYVAWGPCVLESYEHLEQLRVLWHRAKLYVGVANEAPWGDINTPQDLITAEQYFKSSQR